MSKKCKCEPAPTKTADAITASGIFTSTQLGPKQSLTPAGFLLCEEVPIARIGTQDYLEEELPKLIGKAGVIEVLREPEVVFSLATIASFQGATVTVEHPEDGVSPENWRQLAVGWTVNVRRGAGLLSDFLVADLLITDQEAIALITSKKLKEISCGYDADYEQIAPGRARQVSIVGNHVALVEHARCGPTCSVGDSLTSLPGDPLMSAKKGISSFKDQMRKFFMSRDSEAFEKALDEVPEGAAEGGDQAQHIHIHVGKEAKDGDESGVDPVVPTAPADPSQVLADTLAKFDKRLDAIEVAVGKLSAPSVPAEEPKPAASTPTGDDDTDPPDDPDDDDPTLDENPEPEKPKLTGDSAPFAAEFQDAKARAEILAPGVALPTFDSAKGAKETRDSLCVLRRRALRAALQNDNASIVKSVVGDTPLKGLSCDSAKAFFLAASNLVKQKNAASQATHDVASHISPAFADINKTNADFWASRTA